MVYTVDVYVIKEDLTKAAGKRQGERGISSVMLSYLACKDSIAASVNFNFYLWKKIWALKYNDY